MRRSQDRKLLYSGLALCLLRGIHYIQKGIKSIPSSSFFSHIYIGADKRGNLDAKHLRLLCDTVISIQQVGLITQCICIPALCRWTAVTRYMNPRQFLSDC